MSRAPKPYFLVTVSAAALSLGAGLLARRRSRNAALGGVRAPRPTSEGFDKQGREVMRNALKYFVVPMWLAAGVADWWCHRKTDIEDTTGMQETIIHLLMMGEAGVAVLAGLFLEIDAQILSAMIATFFLHEATAMWDVSYAVTAREVRPVEQHVHSFLEMVPLMAVSLVAILHWPQLQALAGLRTEPLKKIRLKREPVSALYAGGALAAMLAFEVLPYVEEAIRDWRANPGQLKPQAAAAAL